MWKIAGWIGKWAAAALVVSVISIWTTGFIINSYVQNLVKQYNLPIEVPPIALSGVWKSCGDPLPGAVRRKSETLLQKARLRQPGTAQILTGRRRFLPASQVQETQSKG